MCEHRFTTEFVNNATPDLESLKLLLTSLIESHSTANHFATLRISVKSSSFLPFVREIVSSLLKCMINLGNSLTVQYKSPNFFISALFTMSICARKVQRMMMIVMGKHTCISISSAKCRNNPLLNPASCAFALEYAETTWSRSHGTKGDRGIGPRPAGAFDDDLRYSHQHQRVLAITNDFYR
eukprot:759327-Hanusia_phi.AAC.11